MKKYQMIAIIAAIVLMGQYHLLCADLKKDVGYTRLAAQLGDDLPTGRGVTVTQVEAVSSAGCWLPDAAAVQFSGKTITDKTGGGGVSGHATAVGSYLYGNTRSMSPGVDAIEVYAATASNGYSWLAMGFLMEWVAIGGKSVQPMHEYNPNPLLVVMASPSRICNHSWVSSDTRNGSILRRLDFVIEADDFIQVAAVNNGTSGAPLLAGSFNAITTGRTDGNHPSGTSEVDTVYTAGRTCPLIVVPLDQTSATAPVAASAAALLIQAGRDSVSNKDPKQSRVMDRSGRPIINAERAETIKAALMAGAQRLTRNAGNAQIVDYRRDQANRSNNGLDVRFGAGQLDIFNSYHIIAGGEQNNAEDDPGKIGDIGTYGFDVAPYFGGLSHSNTTGSYRFTARFRQFYASLVWHLKIDGGTWNDFNGTAGAYNLDMALFDTTTGVDRLVADSTSLEENTENLWIATMPGRSYRLEVYRAEGQTDFLWDYALAWRMDTPPDTDGDGIDDEWEVQFGLDQTDPADGTRDMDGDGLSALQEYLRGTDINSSDTDGDAATDGDEVTRGTDPLNPDDFPGLAVAVIISAVVAAGLILIGIGRYFSIRKRKVKAEGRRRHLP